MSTDYLLTLLFLLIGSFVSLFTGSISNLSKEELDLLVAEGKVSKEDASYISSLAIDQNFIELFTYSISITLLSQALIYDSFQWWLVILISLSLFLTYFVIRAVIFSIGVRFSLNATAKYLYITAFIARINLPFINFLEFLREKISGIKQIEASRDELSALVESAHDEGSLETEEYKLLTNVMKFKDVFVADVMTPRTVVFSLNANLTVGEVISLQDIKNYSRIPVWEGESLDEGVIGYILTKDLLYLALNDKHDRQLKSLCRKVYFIPENAKIDDALEQMLKKKQHLLIVVDEYGGIDGLISMEDVVETILGEEIVDEADRVVDLRKLAVLKRDKRIQEKNQ